MNVIQNLVTKALYIFDTKVLSKFDYESPVNFSLRTDISPKVRHSSFSYQIFAMQIRPLLKLLCVKTSTFRGKRTGMYVNKLFSLTVGAVT